MCSLDLTEIIPIFVNMDKISKVIGIVSAGAFLSVTAFCLCHTDRPWLALIVAADFAVTYLLLKRRTLIACAMSLIPALQLLIAFFLDSTAWIVTSFASTVAFAVLFHTCFPGTSLRTDRWIGSLIIAEVLVFQILCACHVC